MKARVQAASAPDPTAALFLLAAACVLFYSTEGMSWVAVLLAGAVLLPAFAYLFSSNVMIATGALIISSVMPHYFVTIGGLKARPEHIVTGLVCFAAIFLYKRSGERPQWILADMLVLAFVALNVFSSLAMSIAPSQTFKWSMQQTLVIIPYYLIRLLAGNTDRFQRAVRILLWTGAVEAVYAVICFYSNRLFGSVFGVDVGQYENIPGIYGTQLEANILGSYSGACFIMMLVMYFRKQEKKYLWGATCAYAGLVIALSRAALGATALACCVFAVYALKTKLVTRPALTRVAVAVLAVTVVLGVSILPLYTERFSTLDVSDPSADANTSVRLLTVGEGFLDIAEKPWFGGGTASFQLGFDFKDFGYEDEEASGWIGNTEIRILHDTGIVGLAVFAWFLAWVGIRAVKLARIASSPELVGLLLSAVVYIISFQATEGSMMTFPWIHVGLVASLLAIHQNAEGGMPAGVLIGE